MNQKQFKAAFSKYRAILSGQIDQRFTTYGNFDLNQFYTSNFEKRFNMPVGRVAFVNNGCNYSFPFAWAFGQKGSYRAERVINRNATVLNL